MYNLKRYKNKEKNPPKEILKKNYEAKKQTNVKLTNNNKKTIIFINLNSLKKHYFPQNNRTLQVYILYLRQFY